MPSDSWSKAACTTWRNRFFFEPNRRKTYAWVMPARRAMVSVEVPCRPPAANSSAAIARICARRWSAVIFFVPVLATQACYYSLTSNYHVESEVASSRLGCCFGLFGAFVHPPGLGVDGQGDTEGVGECEQQER